MQKLNAPTDRPQKVDEKNGVICLAIICTPGGTDTKMAKMAHFLYFLSMTCLRQNI